MRSFSVQRVQRAVLMCSFFSSTFCDLADLSRPSVVEVGHPEDYFACVLFFSLERACGAWLPQDVSQRKKKQPI